MNFLMELILLNKKRKNLLNFKKNLKLLNKKDPDFMIKRIVIKMRSKKINKKVIYDINNFNQ